MIETAVFDAGPLFSALVSNFNMLDIKRSGRMRHSSVLESALRSERAQRDLLSAFSSIPTKLTTSHVIGELQGLQNSRLKLKGIDLSSFWQTSIDLLRQWAIDEQLVRLLDLASDDRFGVSLPRIGAPDAGVIKLALQRNCVLVTDDERTLAPAAWRVGVDCRLLQQLIPTGY
jgi:hypothetical protein